MTTTLVWLDATTIDAALPRLGDILTAVVGQNASVGFMWPIDAAHITAYWQGVAAAVRRNDKAIVVAYDAQGQLVGTAQIEQAGSRNGAHRAEVMKVLVHPDAQRHGVGGALMQAVETYARMRGWTLLLLDTKLGDSGERLYTRAGWTKFGEVPDYAYSPDGTLAWTSFWYKKLT